jgi:hypothetical protein
VTRPRRTLPTAVRVGGAASCATVRSMWRMCLAAGLLAGCPSNERPPACTTVDLTCADGYIPTFDNVYKNTLRVDCGGNNSSCHAGAAPQGGLSLATQTEAYAGLMAASELDGPRLRVEPGNAACSLMIVRVMGKGHDYVMPPDAPLAPEEQCALAHWVQMGAMP